MGDNVLLRFSCNETDTFINTFSWSEHECFRQTDAFFVTETVFGNNLSKTLKVQLHFGDRITHSYLITIISFSNFVLLKNED